MKVYVKKKDRQSMLPGIIIITIFLAFSIGVFVSAFNYEGSFLEFLEGGAVLILFAIIFFAFGIFFLYMLIKPSKGYRVKLVSKETENYRGKEITYMKFNVKKNPDEEPIKSSYNCYTIGENNLIVEKDYILKIKEFNWQPKYIEDINEYYERTKTEAPTKLPEMNISPVLLAIRFIFGGMTLFCILGIILHPQYLNIYLIEGVIFGGSFYATHKLDKILKRLDKEDKKNNNINIDLNFEQEEIEDEKDDEV